MLPCKLGHEMGVGKLYIDESCEVVDLLLAFIDILAQGLGILPVTSLAGAVYVGQRAHDMVVGVFHTALRDIRHVAVGTRHASLSVYALQ